MRALAWTSLSLVAASACTSHPEASKARLGELLFQDPDLSSPAGQACADCHSPRVAFIDPEDDHTSSAGVVAGRFGARNAPTVLYAAYIPARTRGADGQLHGGLFWDGRADSLETQLRFPLLDPLEMNNPDEATVVDHVRQGPYADLVRAVYGEDAFADPARAFADVADALAAYERSPALAPFSSKYDRYLAGTASLTDAERRGLGIFDARCASCHPDRPAADGTPPLFTTYGYANLGVPRYGNNKFFRQPPPWNPAGDRYVDRGLGAQTGDPRDDGAFRIPTLRNIARTAPYGHNGYFANLPLMLDFLSTRDTGSTAIATCSRAPGEPAATCAWPPPEIPQTATRAIGDLRLSAEDLADLGAFLGTLTDEPPPTAPSTR